MSVNTPHNGLRGAVQRTLTRKWTFLGAFTIIFFLTFGILAALDLVPEANEDKLAIVPQTAGALNALSVEEPLRIEATTIDLEARVANPKSTDVKTLDAALHDGAVRYPTSAKLGEEGNVVLFGHSSYLPIVNNPSYKAFNAIQDLEKDERITLYGNGHAYVYAVDAVYKADADEDAIPLTTSGYTLTLVTCDSFATKSDRFIVTATLVESYPLAN